MTIQEAITEIDDLKPNNFDAHHKIKWLSDVDGRIYKEILSNFMDNEEKWEGYSEHSDLSTKLLAEEPYDGLYLAYLGAMIDYWNGEYDRYNNQISLFNDTYQAYSNHQRQIHTNGRTNTFLL